MVSKCGRLNNNTHSNHTNLTKHSSRRTTQTPQPTTTTQTPQPTTTTQTPQPTTTTQTPQNATTTQTPQNATTTQTPQNTTTKPSPTTSPPGVCNSNPCDGGSTCQERANSTYECYCLTGDYYNGHQCVRAKVFPGQLTYNKSYVEGMENTKSLIFKETADDIVNEMGKTFKDSAKKYLDTTVLKLSKAGTKMMRAAGIVATVDIKFDLSSDVTTADVKTAVADVGAFNEKNLCDDNPCDKTTTTCNKSEGDFNCTCNEGYIPTNFSDRICAACPEGQKAQNNNCIKCSFGYSGFNCDNNWQLILVIVGSVFGGLLLVTIILLPVVAVTTKKKFKKGKGTDNEKSFMNTAPMKTPQISNGTAAPRPIPAQASPAGGRPGFGGNGVPRIPRATTNESWDRSNLEMVPSNSRQNLIPVGRNSRRYDDNDDSNPYSRPMRPQSNPYAIGRPQVNPYGSSQGHSNPYYSSADRY
ncbi:mucin-13b [Boleophthalmus pectinirostris]|uniref:mucin-13b n=1 Tax=Boleophthalmus pectinirostris TaxID=150288 RepID=UPI00242BEF3A|nr:mucin-13b [Boleophthalmus pectinirostris]